MTQSRRPAIGAFFNRTPGQDWERAKLTPENRQDVCGARHESENRQRKPKISLDRIAHIGVILAVTTNALSAGALSHLEWVVDLSGC
jgi:hypothetical protein